MQGDTETTLVFTFKRSIRGDLLTILYWATDKFQRKIFDSNGESMRGIGQNLEQWKISRVFFHTLRMALALKLFLHWIKSFPRPPNYSILPLFLRNFFHYFLLLKRSILCFGLYFWCYNKKTHIVFYIFILHYR